MSRCLRMRTRAQECDDSYLDAWFADCPGASLGAELLPHGCLLGCWKIALLVSVGLEGGPMPGRSPHVLPS
eukprot:11221450-Lingulodinium_polyedra.AAC.1